MSIDVEEAAAALRWLGLSADHYLADVARAYRPGVEAPDLYHAFLKALEKKGYMVLLRSPKPREKRPYTVKLVNCPKGGHTEVRGPTITDAVIAAAIEASKKETG